MKLLVGLGNPGKRYEGTRHNIGFVVIDQLARSCRAGRFLSRFDAEIAEGMEGDEKVLLAKPQTFMNRSGRTVRQIVDFYQLPYEDLLIICDDVNLPLGQLRARARGTHGGHNGLRDIQNHLGTTEYGRLRIGVGAPEGRDMADYVLDRFQAGERKVVEDAVLRALQAAAVWMNEGMEACMNRFNANPG
jgi:peptidyl-tRNA hydrolase, PTH1 family